ncbi:FkbM family methyltransferase [Ancylobacter mangrovi]|uniref:FkbM family methyltransferase n=1 Tax=Ancylobacter mangrovi TaxID=2972472 RepID=UPI002162829D|nr:FkbM family methyltransferase [Ancylobacter mangrovi]MCS0504872.1 FkbM family methyltransferase [Ancylobacter mangrovi]
MIDLELATLRARKLAFGLSHPRMRKALRQGVAAAIDHREALGPLKPQTVLDVGANRGQFALIARHLWPQASIISFEPLPGPAAYWHRAMEGDARARLVQAAIGAERQTMKINVTSADDSSSLLPLGETHQKIYGSSVTDQIEVKVAPLGDFVAPEEFRAPTLLKIDTQGFELEVLKGMAGLEKNISHVYAELSFVELYAGQPLASEVLSYLDGVGFELAGVYNIAADKDGKQIQADMLLKNRNA